MWRWYGSLDSRSISVTPPTYRYSCVQLCTWKSDPRELTADHLYHTSRIRAPITFQTSCVQLCTWKSDFGALTPDHIYQTPRIRAPVTFRLNIQNSFRVKFSTYSMLYFCQQENHENWNPRARRRNPRAWAARALLIYFAVTKRTVQLQTDLHATNYN